MRNSEARPPVQVANEQILMTYATEADARSGFRQLAEAYGWLAEEEVVIPGWGRIDLVLRSTPSAAPFLIELKKELRKPAHIRRAFQQADGYGRWWARSKKENAHSVLVGMDCDWNQIQPVAATYPDVDVLAGDVFMRRLFDWDRDPGERALRAHGRLASLEALLAVHRRAVNEMDSALARSPRPTETNSD